MPRIYGLSLIGLALLIVAAMLGATYTALRKATRLSAARMLLAPVGILMCVGAIKLWSTTPLAAGVLGPISVAVIIAALAPIPWAPVTLLGLGSGFILPMVIAGIALWPDVWMSVLAWLLAVFFAIQTSIEIKRARDRAREKLVRKRLLETFRR